MPDQFGAYVLGSGVTNGLACVLHYVRVENWSCGITTSRKECVSLSIPRVGDLEIDQDLGEQERSWTIQRVAWAIMALIVLTAMLGLWGHGLLADGSAGSNDAGLEIDYERLVRHRGTSMLDLIVSPDETQGETVDVTIDLDWLSSVSIASMIPEPDSVTTNATIATYTFAVGEPGAPLKVVIEIRPLDYWRQTARFAVGERDPVSFSQFIYP